VVTQIELPPYHGPWSLLDLVASDVVFGRIFEAFRLMSQAKVDVVAIAPAGDDNLLRKRTLRVPLMKKIMAPK
jgi:hypothetical protein